MNQSMGAWYDIDWNPMHGSAFTGAGLPWSPMDSRPQWFIDSGINFDPNYSKAFRDVELPLAKAVAVAAALVFTAGTAAPALFGGVAAGAGLNAGMTSALYLGLGGAAGVGAGAGLSFLSDKAGLAHGEGWLAENADKLGLVIGGSWLAWDQGGKKQPTLEDAKNLGEQILSVTPPPKAPVPKPRQAVYAPGMSQPVIGPAPEKKIEQALGLGALAFLAYKMA